MTQFSELGQATDTVFGRGRDFIKRLMPYGRNVAVSQGLDRRADNFLLLRIIAASLVIYGHAAALAPAVSGPDVFARWNWGAYSGDIAVNIFFLISGFLVTGSLLRQRSLLRFLKLRALRVVPGYFVNLVLLALPIGALLSTLPLSEYLHDRSVWHYIVQNMRFSSDMAWKLPGVFESGMKSSTINGSQWTLPAEVRMYVLLGIAGSLGFFAKTRIAMISVAVALLCALVWPHMFPLHQDWFRLGFYFALGVLIFLCRDRIVLSIELVVALVALAVITRHLPIYPQVFALALAASVFAFAYLTPVAHWLERFGDPSYGIYLWGWPSQQCVVLLLPQAGLVLHVALALLMAITLGYASWHLIEKQALRWK